MVASRAARHGFALAALAFACTVQAQWPEPEVAGDVLQVGIPLFALGLTFMDDPAGPASRRSRHGHALAQDEAWLRMKGSPRHNLLLAVARTELATYSLKYSVSEQRPNGGGQSFPSGHTSVAFAGAEFIRKQYGWSLGLPSYLAACYVGWSRIETWHHYEEEKPRARRGFLSQGRGRN